jgi:hypothetical protein
MGVFSTFKRSTFKPSNDPLVPLRLTRFGATIREGNRISLRSGETTPLSPVSKDTRAAIGNCSNRSRSQTPIRSELQVVPRSSVLRQGLY